MTDNIQTKDRDGNNIALAAKDVGNALLPRNIITDPSGNDLNLAELSVAILRALESMVDAPWIEPMSSRMRVVLDSTGGAQTLGTVSSVTTVATLTSMSQIAGVPANSMVYDIIDTAWANCIRGRIT